MRVYCEINENSDVKVETTDNRDFKITVKDHSPWAERFEGAEAALKILLIVREAHFKVPPEVISELAKQVVKATFDSGRL